METMGAVKELRSLALKELEFFHEGKAEAISSFLDVDPTTVSSWQNYERII